MFPSDHSVLDPPILHSDCGLPSPSTQALLDANPTLHTIRPFSSTEMGLSNSLDESLESKTLGNIMALIFLQICPNRQREGWQMRFRAASIPFRTAWPHHVYCRTIGRSSTEPCLCPMVPLNSTWATSKDSLSSVCEILNERSLSAVACYLFELADKVVM